jgi:hypothetical protein
VDEKWLSDVFKIKLKRKKMDLYYEQGFNQNMGWRFEFFWFN